MPRSNGVVYWEDRHPREIAAALGEQGIFVWDGNYYALAVTTCLGLEGKGGMVRIGTVHYNTVEEIRRLGDALRERVLSLVLDRIIEYNHGHYYALAVTERSSLEGGALEHNRRDSEAGGSVAFSFPFDDLHPAVPNPVGRQNGV